MSDHAESHGRDCKVSCFSEKFSDINEPEVECTGAMCALFSNAGPAGRFVAGAVPALDLSPECAGVN